MKIEIKIGREVDGPCVLNIPGSYRKVGRRHATIFWSDGTATIEDNESLNGTYVNGRRIAKTRITETDNVWLGGKDETDECYKIDLKKLFESCRRKENAQRTDYSNEFEGIKQAYIDYQQEVSELKSDAMKKSQMPRLMATFIPAVIGLLIVLATHDNTLKIVAMSIGSVMSGLVGMLTLGKNSAANEQLAEEVTELQIKYQSRYCCPKCGMKYPFTMHWKKLEADGKCPNPKCNATFVK